MHITYTIEWYQLQCMYTYMLHYGMVPIYVHIYMYVRMYVYSLVATCCTMALYRSMYIAMYMHVTLWHGTNAYHTTV